MRAGDTSTPATDVLRGDFHVHSRFSDDATSTVAENIEAADAAGLHRLRLVDHVRSTTTWVPEFLAAVAAEPVPEGLVVYTGVEAKLLDVHGSLDLPAGLVPGTGGLDAIVIGDHQFPGTDGPWTPEETRLRLKSGYPAHTLLELYIQASVNAMQRQRHAQLGHWFSILPKVGLAEDDLSEQQLSAWADAAAENGTLVEVNEKWGCPGPRAISAAQRAGACLVTSSDSHHASTVGRYRRVGDILRASHHPSSESD